MPKLRILIPKKYSEWLPKSNPVASTALEKKITELVREASVRLKKKIFGTKILYSLDVNAEGFHRLIFEKINLLGEASEVVYVLRGIAVNHEYDKAIRGDWSPIEPTSVTDENYLLLSDQVEEDDTDDAKEIFYDWQWITPTESQVQLLDSTISLPHIVIGPPGSGKSLVSLAFFQERATNHMHIYGLPSEGDETRSVLKLLYVSPQQILNAHIKKVWGEWAAAFLGAEHDALVTLECKTPEDLLRINIPEGVVVEVWDKTATIATLNRLIKAPSVQRCADEEAVTRGTKAKKKQKREAAPCSVITITAEQLYDEFWTCSHVLNEDMQAAKTFEESKYKDLGVRQSSLQEEKLRKLAYEIYSKLNAEMSKAHDKLVLIPGLSRNSAIIRCPVELKYDYAFADEAQNLSVQDIDHIMFLTDSHKLIIAGDPLQDMQRLSSLTRIKSHYHEYHGRSPKKKEDAIVKREIAITTLADTHRLSHGVARVCNALVMLSNALLEGKDELAYSDLRSMQKLPATEEITPVNIISSETLSSVAERFSADANIAVMVLTTEDIAQAEGIYGRGKVYYVGDARGLQFPKIIVHLSDQVMESFASINNKMREKSFTASTVLPRYTCRPPIKEYTYDSGLEMLSNLMVALSRSCAEAWICCKEPNAKQRHHIGIFYEWLQHHCFGKKELVATASTKEEWIAFINQLLDNTNFDRAKKLLTDHFDLKDTTSSLYIRLYCDIRAKGYHPSLSEHLEVIYKIRREDASSPESASAAVIAADRSTIIKKEKKKEEVKGSVIASAAVIERTANLLSFTQAIDAWNETLAKPEIHAALNSGLAENEIIELLEIRRHLDDGSNMPWLFKAMGVRRIAIALVRLYVEAILGSRLSSRTKLILLAGRKCIGTSTSAHAMINAIEQDNFDLVKFYFNAILNSELMFDEKLELLNAPFIEEDNCVLTALGMAMTDNKVDIAKFIINKIVGSNLPTDIIIKLLRAQGRHSGLEGAILANSRQTIQMYIPTIASSRLSQDDKISLLHVAFAHSEQALLSESRLALKTYYDTVKASGMSKDAKRQLSSIGLKIPSKESFCLAMENGRPSSAIESYLKYIFSLSATSLSITLDEKIEKLGNRFEDGHFTPAFFVAMQNNHLEAVKIYANTVLRSTLSDKEKIALLSVKYQSDMSIPPLYVAMQNNSSDVVEFYVETILSSSFTHEEKMELLAANSTGAKIVPGLFIALLHGGIKALKCYINEVLKSSLNEDDKVFLLAARGNASLPGIRAAIQKEQYAAVKSYFDYIMVSGLSLESKLQLLKAEILSAPDFPWFFAAMKDGSCTLAKMYVDYILRLDMSSIRKTELLAVKYMDEEDSPIFAFTVAMMRGNIDVVGMFLDSIIKTKQLSIDEKRTLLQAKMPFKDGEVSALYKAIQSNHTSVVELYLKAILGSDLESAIKIELLTLLPIEESDCSDSAARTAYSTIITSSDLPTEAKDALLSAIRTITDVRSKPALISRP